MTDLMSQTLSQLRLRGALYKRVELGAPWALSYAPGARGVHVLTRGHAELVMDEAPWRVETLQAGDVVIVPNGHGHTLRSAGWPPSAQATPLTEFLAGGQCPLTFGGQGQPCEFLCGRFIIDEHLHGPAFEALPSALILRGRGGQPREGLRAIIDVLTHEVRAQEPGGELVITRLSDALVVLTLRLYASEHGAQGWMTALRDARMGPVLSALHSQPERAWSVEELARVAGMSRAAFAARFMQVVGEPPMRYLTRVRMGVAQALLRQQQRTLAQIAAATGYGSEAAFSVAFKRWVGQPPATYRRAALGPWPDASLAEHASAPGQALT